ncbi:hypothetical protein K1719_003222 [Acacia pycnantha]|nr:hypothetical protein K1719_003222 [Acacia pycnantha]
MNPSSMLLVFSLLLLSLLHSKSEGIRLDEGLSTDPQNLLKRSDNGGCDEEEANISNQVHNYISIAGTIKEKTKMIENNENAKGNREGEETKVNWVVTPLKKQHEEEVDMAEMDYTAANRKPPIHN